MTTRRPKDAPYVFTPPLRDPQFAQSLDLFKTDAERRREQTARARTKRSEITDSNRRRAAELRDVEKLSTSAIARRMTREAGRPEDRPITDRQVRRWLAKVGPTDS